MLTSLHPYDQVICIGLDSSPGPDWPSVLAGAVHWRRTPALRLRSGPPCWGRLPQPAGWTPPELLLAPCRRTSERYARLGPAHLDLPDQYRGGNLMTTPSSLYAMKCECQSVTCHMITMMLSCHILMRYFVFWLLSENLFYETVTLMHSCLHVINNYLASEDTVLYGSSFPPKWGD